LQQLLPLIKAYNTNIPIYYRLSKNYWRQVLRCGSHLNANLAFNCKSGPETAQHSPLKHGAQPNPRLNSNAELN